MEPSLATLMIQEIDSAEAYVQRLAHIVSKYAPQLKANEQLERSFSDHYRQVYALLYQRPAEEMALSSPFLDQLETVTPLLTQGLRAQVRLAAHFDSIRPLTQTAVNHLYEFAHSLHVTFDGANEYRVELPRLLFAHMVTSDHGEIPLFRLGDKGLQNLQENANQADFICFQTSREKAHQKLIRAAHHLIFEKDYARALDKLQQACRLKETGQGLTLQSWCHYLLGNMKKAKEFCYQAMKREPDLGDPYNDLGSYLLHEGKVAESLKWFARAKRAKYYLHREFPYINSAKAFLMMKKPSAAIEEFKSALKFAPYKDELLQTLEKLKNQLPGSKETSHGPPFEAPPPQ